MPARPVSVDVTDRVLVAMDGSPESEAALEYALGLSDVAVTIVTVVDPFDVDPLTPGLQSPLGQAGLPAYSQEWYEAEWRAVGEYQERMADRAAEAGVEVRTVRKLGRPARAIVEYATEADVDQIVVGATSEGELSRVLMGSTAEAVARRSPVTVTVVRPD